MTIQAKALEGKSAGHAFSECVGMLVSDACRAKSWQFCPSFKRLTSGVSDARLAPYMGVCLFSLDYASLWWAILV